ncbi:transcription initiation factor TFIID subunit 9B-like isoform X2 [Pomacea canaliculata]|uniref:transcription initiation factor TFIID subunit 9B-like isoform X2 n=1 Tax=Pomacea canaliculata TaxID=400727 RepID=UPI000D72E683|nr:transcription initiation factor TFIID subunit 9B-like isoform X2 [Pomacea canaliculata]
MAAVTVKSTPRDAQVMSAILKDMGVLEYEPKLVNQMLEFTFRYITDILDDAKVYASHANKKNIDADDVKLAVQSRTDHSFTNPPPRDLLLDICRQKNSQPLSAIKPYSSPRLPPDRYCLTAPNYRLKTAKKPRIQFGLQPPQRISLAAPGKTMASVTVKSVGAASNTGLSMMSKPGVVTPGQSVTIISKPVTATPKPTIRINACPAMSTPASMPLESSTTSINPLKRKAEDDDYDV